MLSHTHMPHTHIAYVNITTQFVIHLSVRCERVSCVCSSIFYTSTRSSRSDKTIAFVCETVVCMCFYHHRLFSVTSMCICLPNSWQCPSNVISIAYRSHRNMWWSMYGLCVASVKKKNTRETVIKRQWLRRNDFNSKFENRCSASAQPLVYEPKDDEKKKNQHKFMCTKCRSNTNVVQVAVHSNRSTPNETRMFGKQFFFYSSLHCICIIIIWHNAAFITSAVYYLEFGCSASKHREICTAGQMVASRWFSHARTHTCAAQPHRSVRREVSVCAAAAVVVVAAVAAAAAAAWADECVWPERDRYTQSAGSHNSTLVVLFHFTLRKYMIRYEFGRIRSLCSLHTNGSGSSAIANTEPTNIHDVLLTQLLRIHWLREFSSVSITP